jgi:hypothetical protein
MILEYGQTYPSTVIPTRLQSEGVSYGHPRSEVVDYSQLQPETVADGRLQQEVVD